MPEGEKCTGPDRRWEGASQVTVSPAEIVRSRWYVEPARASPMTLPPGEVLEQTSWHFSNGTDLRGL
jgi:hypothetical protein